MTCKPLNREDLADKLVEEAAEVIQGVCKCKRFGPDQEHPETKVKNRNALEKEIGQLFLAIDDVIVAEELSLKEISRAYMEKKVTRKHWDQLNIKKGTVGA